MKKLLCMLLVAATLLLACGSLAAEYPFPLETPVKLTMAITQSANVSDYDNNNLTKWLEERTGIDLELVLFPSTDAATKLKLMIAGGDKLPDIITFGLTADTLYEWGRDGVLLPWNEWLDEYGEGFNNACTNIGIDPAVDVLAQITSPDGNIYASPSYSSSYNNMTQLRVWINEDWMSKLGLEMPKTSDELIDVLKAFRDNDPNGNGLADEIPMLGNNAMNWLQNMFIYYNSVGWFLPLTETEGVLDVAYDKDDYREFLKFANSLVAENLLSPLTFTIDNSQFNALVQAETPVLGVIANGSAPTQFSTVKNTYTALEIPMGPNGAQYTSRWMFGGGFKSAVTCDCENPDIAMALIMFQFCDAGADLAMVTRYGEKDVDWRYYDAAVDTNLIGAIPGKNPYIVELGEVWGRLTDKLWQAQPFSYVMSPDWWVGALKPDAEVKVANYYFGINFEKNAKYMPDASGLFSNKALTYTGEEQEKWSDARVALNSYINEARSLFALGELDPNSDTDWANYLAELNNLRYKEILAVDQTSYNRLIANAAK